MKKFKKNTRTYHYRCTVTHSLRKQRHLRIDLYIQARDHQVA